VQVIIALGKDHLGVARGMIDSQDMILATVQEFIREGTTQPAR
jgi:hypothetical protein